MGKSRQHSGVSAEKVTELLPGMEWLADHDDFDDGDVYMICKGRVAEYVHKRGALVVRQGGKEIGFIPIHTEGKSWL